MKKLAAALVIFAGGLSCDSSTEPEITLSGSWVGTVETQQISLLLTQTGDAVTGNGSITNTPSGTRALTVSGTHIFPNATLTLSSGTTTPFSMSGTVGKDQMSASLTGSGFTGEAISMQRQ